MPHVETNEIETYYERWGNGRSIVFVHGLGLDRRSWAPLMTALEDDFDVLAYDYRGHGNTGPTTRDDYSIQLLVDDLRALLDELDIETPILCGHSYGGLIVGEYAAQYPDDVAGVIFADARLDFGETRFERILYKLWPALRQVAEIVGMERFERGFDRIAELFVDVESGPNEEIDELEMTPEEYRWDAREPVTVAELSKLYQAAAEFDGINTEQIASRTLFVYGGGTTDVIKRTAARTAARLDDVAVEAVDDAGHGFPISKPSELAEILCDWAGEARRQEVAN